MMTIAMGVFLGMFWWWGFLLGVIRPVVKWYMGNDYERGYRRIAEMIVDEMRKKP